jgi:predicted transcriptional regulator
MATTASDIGSYLYSIQILELIAKQGPQTDKNIFAKLGVSANKSLDNLIKINYVVQKDGKFELTTEGHNMYDVFVK